MARRVVPGVGAFLVAAAVVVATLGGASPARAQSLAAPATGDDRTGQRVVISVSGSLHEDLEVFAAHGGARLGVHGLVIPGWLAIELGAGLLYTPEALEVPLELMLRKPFRVYRGLEIMLGVGPEVVWISATRASQAGAPPVAEHLDFGARVAADLWWWPTRHVGLSFGPAYEVLLRDGLQRYNLGVTGGVLFGF